MSQVITNAFASYWQDCLADELPVVLDAFVLANIPDLDPDLPISPDDGLPPAEHIVYRQTVDQRGRINLNAVAYTIVMDTSVGDFEFNAMYLINTETNLVGMIVHKGLEKKIRSDKATGQTGNSLVKSMLMEYDRASLATVTTVDASTWQIDYSARLRGLDEDMRRVTLPLYGPAWFEGDGFLVNNNAGVYHVNPGEAVVGGLLVVLSDDQIVTPDALPMGVWVDVHRAGTLLGAWENHVSLVLSNIAQVDYTDGDGYQHHVAQLAIINADSSLTDTRRQRTHDHHWDEILDPPTPPTPEEIGAAPVDHTHPGTIITPVPLAKEDLNTLTTPKVYRQDSDANAALVLNYPEAKSGSLIVTVGAGVQQRYHVYNSSRVYTRAQYNTGAFTPWAREYNTQNKPSAEDVGALAKIGDTATGNIIAPKFIMNTSQGTGPGDAVRYDFLPGSIPKLSPLISGHLNNFTEKGFYQQNATSPDPGGTLGYPVNYSGGLLVFSNGGGMCQIYLTNPNGNGGQRRIYYRNYWIGSWGPWTAIYDTNFKPTAADVGAASASHTHTPASIGAANTMRPFINGGSRDGFTQCTVSIVRWGRAYPLTFAIPSTTTAFWIANRGGENADRDYDFGVNCVRSGSNMTLTPVGSDATISTIHIM
ncbi:phage tail protein [Aeromonas sp.]|uniref:phage tail-collar fiber domain-containing protein n=1 Tax=Aeromonas sp. TaxID=647 RepID=UPI00258F24DF|nr:phage tail protein [Aeromonas sp.]MCX7132472.1 phage tail protein [Aeromonas sp.]